jgi:type I restriction enzyme S subunit
MTKRYNEYKDSGIEWLGETPNHWNVSKIKNKIKKSVGGFWGKDPLGNKNENLIPALRVNNFNKEKLIIESNDLKIRNIKHDEFKIRKVLYNDLLIERSGGWRT